MSARDTEYQTRVLAELLIEVRRLTGEDITPFAIRIDRRIAHGAVLYGDATFLTDHRDLLSEASDEDADGFAYRLFQLERLNANAHETPVGVHQLLFDAMVHGAIAEMKTRQARRALLLAH